MSLAVYRQPARRHVDDFGVPRAVRTGSRDLREWRRRLGRTTRCASTHAQRFYGDWNYAVRPIHSRRFIHLFFDEPFGLGWEVARMVRTHRGMARESETKR